MLKMFFFFLLHTISQLFQALWTLSYSWRKQIRNQLEAMTVWNIYLNLENYSERVPVERDKPSIFVVNLKLKRKGTELFNFWDWEDRLQFVLEW